MHASVRELKARLSQLLRQVEAGATTTVQAHSRQVAEIVPIRKKWSLSACRLRAPIPRRQSNAPRHRGPVSQLNADWESIVRVELTASVLRLAGETAETYELRGFDSFHLASALSLRDRTNLLFVFAVFDQRLRDGAARAGLALLP